MSDDREAPTTCPRCSTAQPASARFCHRCGYDHLASGPAHYALAPNERVRTINPVTALMPLTNGRGVQTYQAAIGIGVAITVLAAAIGWVPFALAAAAALVPVVFTIYLYDVNEWDDQPIPVVLATIVLAGLFGAAAAWAIQEWLLDPGATLGFDRDGIDPQRLLVLGLVAPLVALMLSFVGPLWLASRPHFDDMIDGLTFGAVAGGAYAAGETLMAHRGILGSDSVRRDDPVLWMSIVANAGAVKPLVYGSAVAIAVAAFSGIGPGYEGFRDRFARGTAIATTGMAAYALGVTLLGDIGGWLGATLGLLWGLAVAAVLVIVLRTRLHLGVLEAALEAARGKPSRHEVVGEAFCGECDMPLAPLALFCSACGTSVRATSKTRQHANVARPAGAPT